MYNVVASDLTAIRKTLNDHDTIYISGHVNPDGDAIGACLALALGVSALGKTPMVLIDNLPAKYDFLSGREFIYTGEVAELMPGALFVLDVASKSRLTRSVRTFFDICAPTVVIDHHINPGFGDINIIDPQASSASEMVFGVLKGLGGAITPAMAEAVLTGVIFDTGGFKHACSGPSTFRTVAELLELGANLTNTYTLALDTRSIGEARIMATALQKMVIEGEQGEPAIAYSVLSNDDLSEAGAVYADLDGIAEYMLSIRGVEVSLLLSERFGQTYKLSFRAKATDVNHVASSFGGGGHHLAAGAAISGEISDTLPRVLAAIRAEMDS